MTSQPKPPPRVFRTVYSLLVDTGPAGDPNWRWSLPIALGLFGPGSVPFALLMFGVENQVLRTNYGVDTAALFIGALTGGSVVLARFRALPAWLVAMAAFVWSGTITTAQSGEPWPLTIPGMFALWIVQFTVARDCRVWVSVLTWVGSLLVGMAFAQPANNPIADQNVLLMSMLGALMLALGIAVRVNRRARHRVAEEERLTAEERARRGLLEERTRIARELHDVVAHHMSVITVQAQTAEYRLPGLPSEAVTEFRSISDQARESLGEMRRLLAVLRNEDEAALRAPQPGLDRWEALTDSARRAGVPLHAEVAPLPDSLPEALSLTGYRIIQEALSNVVKYAPGADTRLTVAVDEHGLRVTVHNGPSPDGAADTELSGAGLGLAGMRERVTLVGGTLRAEPTDDGGFLVDAELPLPE